MAGDGKGGWAFIGWYATLFRGDRMEKALNEIGPVALRYGATAWAVYRSRGDRYSFSQYAYFEDGLDFERYWYGPEFNRWRQVHQGWFQVPVVPDFHDQIGSGALTPEPADV